MIANKGSEFSRSVGDEPGVAGGVVSGVNMKESTWISYSFDVKMEGRNACRLTDKKFQNHANTVDAAGVLQQYLPRVPELAIICEAVCECKDEPLPQQCVTSKLNAHDRAAGYQSTIKPEINYRMWDNPPSPIMSRRFPLRGTRYLPARLPDDYIPGLGQVRRPDAVIVNNPMLPPTQDNLRAVVEVKFPPDTYSDGQQRAYERIAGPDADLITLTPEECDCPERRRRRSRVRGVEVSPVDILILLALTATLLTPIPGDEALVAVAAGARLTRLLPAFAP
jgi:hypothetical protein